MEKPENKNIKAIERGRSSSEGNIKEYFKRKRSEEEAKMESEEEIFRKSKLVARSPIKTATEVAEKLKEASITDSLLDGMLAMRIEILQELKEFKENNEKLVKEFSEAIKTWKEEKSSMQKEIESLKKEIQEMKLKEEIKEKEKRRRNILIYGDMGNITGDNLEKEVESFINKELSLTVNVRKAVKVGNKKMGKPFILAKLKSLEEKKEVMINKRKLRKEIFIKDDLTVKEREIQKEIGVYVKKEKEKGKNIRAGYQKVFMDGIWKKWEEVKNGVKETE